jgi:hypothetical protein
MQLWKEYELRHNLQVPEEKHIPFIFTRIDSPVFPLWSYFLYNYRFVIRITSKTLDDMCTLWTRHWEIPPKNKKPVDSPTLHKQKEIVFSLIPELINIWSKWLIIEPHEFHRTIQNRAVENMNLVNSNILVSSSIFNLRSFVDHQISNTSFSNV